MTLRSIAALSMLGLGVDAGLGTREPRSTREERDWSQVEQTYTPKPKGKRAKRRERGKAKGRRT